MKPSILLCTLLALAGTTTFAQEATSDDWMNVASTKSRSQVQAELQQARKDGTVRAWSAGYIEPLRVSRTRAEVVASTLAARDSGELAAINSEVYRFDPVPATRLASTGR